MTSVLRQLFLCSLLLGPTLVLADPLNGGFGRPLNGFGGAGINQPHDNAAPAPQPQGEDPRWPHRERGERRGDDHGNNRAPATVQQVQPAVQPRHEAPEHRDVGRLPQQRPGQARVVITPSATWHGDVREFRRNDMNTWRSGHWVHGHHHHHLGWWWVIGGSWYFYDQAIYPYPSPYVPGEFDDDPDAGAYWYYCEDPQGYYPYVPVCNVDWLAVPAQLEE